MRVYTAEDFDYHLPADRIARHPAVERTASRLLHVPRGGVGPFEDRFFSDLVGLMKRGDVLVLNDTRVMRARFVGAKPTGARVQVLLLRPHAESPSQDPDQRTWEALVRPGGKLKPGRVIRVAEDLEIEIVASQPDGGRLVRLHGPLSAAEAMSRHGQVPIPPYLERAPEALDVERYQTVYARWPGSVAAPTAGLHFDDALLDRIRGQGVQVTSVTLHVGVGTFRPVEEDDLERHVMHREWYEVPETLPHVLAAARTSGGRVWAVGTTVARTLEAAADKAGVVAPGAGSTQLFIRPPYEFRVVDALITNFHLPRSTLLMLVSAFAGYDTIRESYVHAIRGRYRFYSYGDAMVLT